MTPADGELDLDSRPEPTAAITRGPLPILLTVLALVLAAAATGAVLRTATAGDPVPPLPEAQLALADATFEGGAIALLRVTVHNPAAGPLTVRTLVADGFRGDQIRVAARATVAAGATEAVTVRVVPDCSAGVVPRSIKARLVLGDGRTVDALPDRSIGSAGSICRRLNTLLPRGWWAPLFNAQARRAGDGLQVLVPPLPQDATEVVGVWAGETLLTTRGRAMVVDGRLESFVLDPPAICAVPQDGKVPTGLRLMTTGDGLRERYLPLGPVLAEWLTVRC